MTSSPTTGRRVLLVEDELPLAGTLALSLRGRGYDVTAVGTGTAALEAVATGSPDVLVLDLGLPDMDGLDVIRAIRDRRIGTPIVVLSARAAVGDKVTALDLGACDYVTKPFDMEEFAARLRAAVRRDDSASVVRFGAITIDVESRTACRAGSVVRLTPTEWRILEIMVRRPGRLVTSAELLAVTRRDRSPGTAGSYLRIYLQQLRRKLEDDPTRPAHLITEPGLGYRFVP